MFAFTNKKNGYTNLEGRLFESGLVEAKILDNARGGKGGNMHTIRISLVFSSPCKQCPYFTLYLPLSSDPSPCAPVLTTLRCTGAPQ
jgi:hypothetical protein